MSVNKVILVGNLGRDPEVRHLPTGMKVANFSLATSMKRKTGEQTVEVDLVVLEVRPGVRSLAGSAIVQHGEHLAISQRRTRCPRGRP